MPSHFQFCALLPGFSLPDVIEIERRKEREKGRKEEKEGRKAGRQAGRKEGCGHQE